MKPVFVRAKEFLITKGFKIEDFSHLVSEAHWKISTNQLNLFEDQHQVYYSNFDLIKLAQENGFVVNLLQDKANKLKKENEKLKRLIKDREDKLIETEDIIFKIIYEEDDEIDIYVFEADLSQYINNKIKNLNYDEPY